MWLVEAKLKWAVTSGKTRLPALPNTLSLPRVKDANSATRIDGISCLWTGSHPSRENDEVDCGENSW
jgi:hypothetical protein